MKLRATVMAIVATALLANAAVADAPSKEDDSGDGVILLVLAVTMLIVMGGAVAPADAGAEVPAGQ